MLIYIDESGAFVSSDSDDSWNCVAVLLVPETEIKRSLEALRQLKLANGKRFDEEIKLKNTSEKNYFNFLTRLA